MRTDHRCSTGDTSIAIAHDYLTQRGGAERVVLLLAETFPDAPIHTSLYHPAGTFPEFAGLDIRTTPINMIPLLRNQHRLALPVLAPSFSALRVDADVLICSSSGWAHGTRTHGRKVVYCHAPARWLYQADRYLGKDRPDTLERGTSRPFRSARSADRCVTGIGMRPRPPIDISQIQRSSQMRSDSSTDVEAEVVPPPPSLAPEGPVRPVEDLEPGYFLCIARLLPYKNVQVVAQAVGAIPNARLVIVGDGPARSQIENVAGPNVRFLGLVDDETLPRALSKLRRAGLRLLRGLWPHAARGSLLWSPIGGAPVRRLSRHGRRGKDWSLLRLARSRRCCFCHDHGPQPNLASWRTSGTRGEVFCRFLPAQNPASRR